MAALTTWEIRIENTRANIEKTRKTIEKQQKTLEKREEKLRALGGEPEDLKGTIKMALDKGDNDMYWAASDCEDSHDLIENNQKKLKELGEKLLGYKEKYNAEVKRNDIPYIPALEEFLTGWRNEATDWYHERSNALAEFVQKHNDAVSAINAKYDPYWAHTQEIEAAKKAAGEDYTSYHKRMNFNFSQDVQGLYQNGRVGDPKYEAALSKMLDEEMQAKRLDLYYRCTSAVGVIADASDLKIGNNGSLNGIVVGESGKKARVETIMAGGYNIQCLHYRVLINPIQEKRKLDEQIQNASSRGNGHKGESSPHIQAQER